MNYYTVKFSYSPETYVGCPGDDEVGKRATSQLFAASNLAEQTAKQHGLEMIHAYSWTDGSLYKYVRSEKTAKEVSELLTVKKKLVVEGKEVTVSIVAMATPLEDAVRISHIFPRVSIVERFNLSREECFRLDGIRANKEKEFNKPYENHRKNCSKCESPGHACEEWRQLYDKATAEWKAYVSTLSAATNAAN